MNQLKRVLGLVWIALAMAAAYFASLHLDYLNYVRQTRWFSIRNKSFILTPLIVLGLGTFGYYALMGDYEKINNQTIFFNLQSLTFMEIAYFNFNKNF
jgi:hypothetical protein